MATEPEIRKTLAEVDRLRGEADLCQTMHTYWIGHDGELVAIAPVILRRRWRSPITTHSERIMTRGETRLLIHWLSDRGRSLRKQADELAATLLPQAEEDNP